MRLPHAWRPSRAGRRVATAALTLVAITASLVGAEALLRWRGTLPGEISHARYRIADEVSLVKGMIADAEGVQKYDAAMRPEIARLVAERASPEAVRAVFGAGYERLIEEMVIGFARSDPSVPQDNPFNTMIDTLAARSAGELSSLERAYLDYARLPLNRSGFRSIELEPVDAGETSVLLLGDSFTWGYSARPLTASFADHLAAAGYAVYNTGITAIGPAQYEHLATKYVPALKPDVVVVNFYIGNDIAWWERKLEPYQFAEYPTSVGFFTAAPRGEYLRDFREAYAYALQFRRIPDQATKPLNRLCARTSLGTKLWLTLARAGFVSKRADRFVAYDARNVGIDSPTPVSETHVRRIKEVTEAHGGRFVLAVIPDLPQSVPHGHSPSDVFPSLEYHVPALTLDDYRPFPDAHFNNSGHHKYADFLISLIENGG